ncbi:hypothetical protein FEM48_Zijuj01G0181200 [Ziziphus jujuba var. spinosa]|uniref:ATP-dependent DNA helicase n=1 Tax=Ziziphus jujuba var. spinosa TaxID=714518 RepID=A0A978W2S4_ZIZJJ|nr:hypothetical protein FEM48_Zijuj01G0181200 [Ziziphus jujuba var. spinosa]
MDSVVDMLDKETEVMGMKKKRNSVSCREYYSYKLQIRSLNDSMILHIGRLLQQFVVDMYVKLETSRLDYFRKNQTEIHAELYQGIMDSVDVGETRGIKVGRRIILPSTFIGGPRDMHRRRRDEGCKVKVRGSVLDNQWVVPYNPYLLAKFDCHINVEICSTIKAVKYLYKYIYKGHDKVAMNIKSFKNNEDIDEIHSFQSARWISPPEAMWRIYGFSLNEMHPHCDVVGRIVNVNPFDHESFVAWSIRIDNSFELCLEEASLYQMPYSLRRSKGLIALATASSEVAASILPAGRTAHSRFKIPLVMEEHNTCHVSKQSGLAKLMKDASLIVWDEAPVVKKEAIESLDKMLQDINECDLLFGGKVVVVVGILDKFSLSKRNINPSEGLCNGTRLICHRFDQNVIDAEISVGEYY